MELYSGIKALNLHFPCDFASSKILLLLNELNAVESSRFYIKNIGNF